MSKEYISVRLDADSVDHHVYIATHPVVVSAIRGVNSINGGSGATVTVRRCQGTTAPASGLALHDAIDLVATVNVVQSPALIPAEGLVLAAGDRLAVDMAGTLTSLVGLVTIEIETGEIR